MGYRVCYPAVGKEKKKSHPLRVLVLAGVAFFLFVQLVQHRWPEGWQLLQQVIVPQRCIRAVTELVEQLDIGVSPAEALTTFCQCLTEGGN